MNKSFKLSLFETKNKLNTFPSDKKIIVKPHLKYFFHLNCVYKMFVLKFSWKKSLMANLMKILSIYEIENDEYNERYDSVECWMSLYVIIHTHSHFPFNDWKINAIKMMEFSKWFWENVRIVCPNDIWLIWNDKYW